MGVSVPNTSSSSYRSQLLAPKSSTAQIPQGSPVTPIPVAPRWPTLGSWATPFALLVSASEHKFSLLPWASPSQLPRLPGN